MKVLLFLLLFLGMMQNNAVYAGFVLRPRASTAAADSPVVTNIRNGYGHRAQFVPTKQVRGIALLAFAGGVLSVAGLIAIIALWPLTFWPALMLIVGTLATGVTAILLSDADGRNIKPHPGWSLTGGLMAFIALLPVLLPVSVLVLLYVFFDRLFG